jgi:exonuclease III
MASRVHKPLKILSFNANGILRQRNDLSKQLEDLRIDVAMFLETNLKPHEKFFLQTYPFTELTAIREGKGELPSQLGKASPTTT